MNEAIAKFAEMSESDILIGSDARALSGHRMQRVAAGPLQFVTWPHSRFGSNCEKLRLKWVGTAITDRPAGRAFHIREQGFERGTP